MNARHALGISLTAAQSMVASLEVDTIRDLELMNREEIEYSELMYLREAFAEAADAGNTKRKGTPYISRAQLADILTSRHPNLEHGRTLERALSVFDNDENGTIDFEEFILAISRASPVGGMTGWRPLMPVTQWSLVR